MHAKGFLPENHSHWAGVIGRARRSDVKRFTDRADLIIAVGYDPIEINYEEWARNMPIVHVNTEAAEPGDGLKFLWNKACDLDAAIEAIGTIEAIRQRLVGRGMAKAPIAARSRLASGWRKFRSAPGFGRLAR